MALQTSLSRRQLLAVAVISGAGTLLTACGGSAAAPSTSSPAAATSAPPKPSASTAAKPAASPSAAAKPVASAQGAQLSLNVAYPAVTGVQTPLWIADATGLFAQQHLKVNLKFIESNVSTKALIAKDIDVLMQAATSLITADLNGAADLVYTASAYNHAQFSLIAAPSIKGPSDLKGKPWGTDHPGTTTDYFTQLLLKLIGLKPTDVEQHQLGGGTILFPALLSGQLVAAPLSPPESFQAEAKGYHSLKDTYDQPYQNVGAVVSRARIPELTPALLAFLTAWRQGMHAYSQQPDVAKQQLKQYGKITDEDTLQKTYDFYIKQTQFQFDLEPSIQGIQYMLDFLSAQVPAAKTAKPEQFIDRRLLDQLPKE